MEGGFVELGGDTTVLGVTFSVLVATAWVVCVHVRVYRVADVDPGSLAGAGAGFGPGGCSAALFHSSRQPPGLYAGSGGEGGLAGSSGTGGSLLPIRREPRPAMSLAPWWKISRLDIVIASSLVVLGICCCCCCRVLCCSRDARRETLIISSLSSSSVPCSRSSPKALTRQVRNEALVRPRVATGACCFSMVAEMMTNGGLEYRSVPWTVQRPSHHSGREF